MFTGWEQAVNSALAYNIGRDVLWTVEEDSYADYHNEFDRRSDIFVTPIIFNELNAYKNFTERNTGTFVGLQTILYIIFIFIFIY